MNPQAQDLSFYEIGDIRIRMIRTILLTITIINPKNSNNNTKTCWMRER